MIEKLKMHSFKELDLSDGDYFRQLLNASGLLEEDTPPTGEEMMNKINEIIDLLNKLVAIDHVRKENNGNR